MTRFEDLKVGDVLKRLVSGCGMNIGDEYPITAIIANQIAVNNLLLSYIPVSWQLIKKETTTMSTKIEQAEKRIEEAMEQLEAAKLALKEAEEVKKNPLFGEIGNDNDLHQLNCTANGGLTGTSSAYRTSVSEVGFTNSKSAGLVAEAISTLLLLRAQDGGFLVYACGDDDYSLEKVFSADQEHHALCLFTEIIGMGTVEVDKLYELGMKGA